MVQNFQVSFKGLTGEIKFQEGYRSDAILALLKLKDRTLKPVGVWTPSKRLYIHDYAAFTSVQAANVTLKVITILVSRLLLTFCSHFMHSSHENNEQCVLR